MEASRFEHTVGVSVVQEVSGDPLRGVEKDDLLMDMARETGRPHLRLWYNAPCIVLGRGYARQLPRQVARVLGLPVLVRSSGGQVVIHGPGVLNVSLAVPSQLWSGTIDDAFVGLSLGVKRALLRLGWSASVGVVPESYCPGDHDVAVGGKKVMGISQRRRRETTLVHGSLNVSIVPRVYADVLTAFYQAAGIDDRPRTERIGTLFSQPPNDGEKRLLAHTIVEALFSFWSDRTGAHWIPDIG